MKLVANKLIDFYKFFSLDRLGNILVGPAYGCKFYPTCSHYTKESINKFGVVRGSAKGLWRVMRCNPFSEGGIDLP